MCLKLRSLLKVASFFFAALVYGATAPAQADLVACGGDKVMLIDSKKSTPGRPFFTFTWKVSEAGDLPLPYKKLMVPLDECKPVGKGKQLLLTSSGGGVVLLDIAT